MMASTDIGNVNCLKLLSTNFIYAKSMWIEKLVFNTVDEEAECGGGGGGGGGGGSGLYLYFVHLYDASDSGHKRHRTRSRNYSVSSTLSAHSHSLTASLSPAKSLGADRLGLSALKTTHFTMNSSGSAYSSYSAYGGALRQSQYGLAMASGSGSGSAAGRGSAVKVLLNFVTAKKSESYSIVDGNQTVKELRSAISARFNIECDGIKVGSERMSDFKAVREYNLGQNEILHVFDESMVTIFVQQSGHGLRQQPQLDEAVEIKLNRKLTVQHIKYHIANILRSPHSLSLLTLSLLTLYRLWRHQKVPDVVADVDQKGGAPRQRVHFRVRHQERRHCAFGL